ncbi:MAG: adenylate/guanylate cyclase domain-containing protein [Myxococcaceae bacterium]
MSLTRVEQLERLTAMSHELTLAETEERVFWIAARATSDLLHADRSSVVLLTRSGGLDVFALVGESAGLPAGREVKLEGTHAGEAIQKRRLISTPDTRDSDFMEHKLFVQVGLLSHMSAPLVTGGEVIGTLNVSARSLSAFGPDDEKLLTEISAVLASHVQNRRLVEELRKAWEQSEALLLNTLPPTIVKRMKGGERTIADAVPEVTVLFADIAGFTRMSAELSPSELVTRLDGIFTDIDAIASRYGVEKIKTIGDCYMAVAGALEPRADHAVAVARMALELRDRVRGYELVKGRTLDVRIGIHSGAVVAGVIGRDRFAYDLWGDTVNTASRMESHGAGGEIHCSESAYLKLRDSFVFESRGPIEVKGKGPMTTYFLRGPKEP